jgi:hypothetical protein
MPESLPVRIVLLAPPADTRWALQVGRAQAATLQPPDVDTPERVVLSTTLAPTAPGADGTFDVRGAAVQGPRGGRFLYAASGQRAGDGVSGYSRRAKISLAGLTPALVARWRRTPGAWLEARVAGTARDGGPACATVPLLDGGWQVVAPPETPAGA